MDRGGGKKGLMKTTANEREPNVPNAGESSDDLGSAIIGNHHFRFFAGCRAQWLRSRRPGKNQADEKTWPTKGNPFPPEEVPALSRSGARGPVANQPHWTIKIDPAERAKAGADGPWPKALGQGSTPIGRQFRPAPIPGKSQGRPASPSALGQCRALFGTSRGSRRAAFAAPTGPFYGYKLAPGRGPKTETRTMSAYSQQGQGRGPRTGGTGGRLDGSRARWESLKARDRTFGGTKLAPIGRQQAAATL